MKRRLIAWLLSIAIMSALISPQTFADSEETSTVTVEETQEESSTESSTQLSEQENSEASTPTQETSEAGAYDAENSSEENNSENESSQTETSEASGSSDADPNTETETADNNESSTTEQTETTALETESTENSESSENNESSQTETETETETQTETQTETETETETVPTDVELKSADEKVTIKGTTETLPDGVKVVVTDKTAQAEAEAEAGEVETQRLMMKSTTPLSTTMSTNETSAADDVTVEEVESLSDKFIAVYDIKLVGENGNVQPEGPVTVQITGVNFTGSDLKIYHFLDDVEAIKAALAAGTAVTVDEEALVNSDTYADALAAANQANTELANGVTNVLYVEILTPSIIDAGTIEFTTSSFSIYAITDESGTVVTYRRTYHFQNADGTDYEFQNEAGETVTYQIIKNGDYLQDVGTPSVTMSQTFLGWYIYDTENNAYTDTQIHFGTGYEITDVTKDEDVYVRARYGTAYYVTYYEDVKGTIVLQRKQVIVDEETGTATININSQTDAAPQADLAFVGWSYAKNEQETIDYDTDNRELITETETTLTGDISVYPVFKIAHWITFVSAPTGSGATYVAPAYVLAGANASSAEPDRTKMKWTGYTFVGWYTADDWSTAQTEGEEFNFDQILQSDVTVYARWTDAQAKYTVVYYRQQVTDAVDAADADKKYDYVGSVERYTTKGTTVSLTTADMTPSTTTVGSDVDASGFSFNETNSVTSVEVAADGTSVLIVRFDRNVYTLAFTVSGDYSQDYVIADDDNDTQYAYVNGEYVELSRIEEATTEYFLSRNQNGNNEYTGTVYSDQYGTVATEPYDTSATYYRREWSGGFFGRYVYYSLYWRTRTATTYEWQLNGETYTGTRYKYEYTQSHIVSRIVALYGQSIKNYFPIVGDDNTVYEGYQWSDVGNPQTYSYVLQTIETMPAADVTFAGSYRGTEKTIYYYVEIVPGESTADLTTRTFNGKTYKLYKTVVHDFNYLTFDEEYHPITGFERNRSWAEPEFGTNNRANIGRGNANYLYYNRNNYTLEFIDSVSNTSLHTDSVSYEASLADYEPTWKPTSTLPGYQFTGWYTDAACTSKFDFTQTMPADAVAVYAGWEKVWYRVEIDPNYGQLTSGESTFFWTTYGSLIEEYGDITRNYIEDENGTYYYLYHPYSSLVEFDDDGNNAYSDPLYYAYWDRIATYSTSTLVNNYSDYNSETGQYDTTTQVEDPISDLTKKYSYEKDAYALVGWYKVNADGSLGSVYNFGEEVTSDITIRAMWRRVGEYHIAYALDGYVADAEGNLTRNTELAGTNAPSDTNTYADQSASSMFPRLTAPTGYVFTGWYYNGSVYEPGDVYTVDAALAEEINEKKTITIYPVFTKVEDLPVEVTGITIDANGGKIADSTLGAGFSAVSENGSTSATLADLDLNAAVVLPGTGYMTRPGYTFVGWSLTSGETNAVNFAAGITVGVDNLTTTGNTLYAVWNQQTVTINYQVVGPDGATGTVGSLSRYQETNLLAATGTASGSTATATAGYQFVGWYSDEACTQQLTTNTQFKPSKNSDGIYEAATYYAKFEEVEVTITYKAVGPDGTVYDADSAVGTLTSYSETIKAVSGTAAGSTAAPGTGYEFVGWYSEAACTNQLSEEAAFTPSKNSDGVYEAATYYAKFKEIEVTINYRVVAPDGTVYDEDSDVGTLTSYSETITAVSGEPTGSTAAAGEIYQFVGWYSDEACTQQLTTNTQFELSKNTDGIYEAATYYAKFDYIYMSLTITKTGTQTIDENQSYIFNVTGTGADGKAVDMDVVINGDGSVTITGLTAGTYTVTEKTGWSFRYTPDAASKEVTLTNEDGTVAFANTRASSDLTDTIWKWLNGDAYKENIFQNPASN